jgi:hypothetical protein
VSILDLTGARVARSSFFAIAVPATYVAVQDLRVFLTPARWPSNTNRWVVSLRMPCDPRPTSAEIRSWGAVWAALGFVFIGIALAAVLAA